LQAEREKEREEFEKERNKYRRVISVLEEQNREITEVAQEYEQQIQV
jgi:hypothetical protein